MQGGEASRLSDLGVIGQSSADLSRATAALEWVVSMLTPQQLVHLQSDAPSASAARKRLRLLQALSEALDSKSKEAAHAREVATAPPTGPNPHWIRPLWRVWD